MVNLLDDHHVMLQTAKATMMEQQFAVQITDRTLNVHDNLETHAQILGQFLFGFHETLLDVQQFVVILEHDFEMIGM